MAVACIFPRPVTRLDILIPERGWTMRLTKDQQQTIVRILHQQLGADLKISLYGSRNDDSRRGGDVDLLLESSHPIPLLQRAGAKLKLEQALNLPVDLLFSETGKTDSSFVSIAKATAQPLDTAA